MKKFILNNIKKYREQMKYTQQELANLIGGDSSQISRYENGEQRIPADKLMRLAAALHVSVEELMGTKQGLNCNYTEDGLPMLSLEKGQVVRRQLFSRVGDKAITIAPDGFQCTAACVRTWEDTEYVHVIVDIEQKLLILRKCNAEDLDAERWSRKKDNVVTPRKVTGKEFATRLYEMMHWSRGYKHRISGYAAVNADDPEEPLWFFELEEAEGIPLTEKCRTKCGVRNEDLAAGDLEKLDTIEKKKNEELERRELLKKEGKDPGPVIQYILHPDPWGQYTFGLPEELHGNVPKIGLGMIQNPKEEPHES